ncbi:MFS transporter [Phaeobacter gallaeciensis]|uniref:MFS type transporter n=1 Tax=Phaeobacter gallaeciensis TaxID=60890 RepID=A0AAC9Z8P5_9RHOB|nr:MFS transporter [Phaeobacter gallaeciensis]AHD09344.1 Arabinose efflux permease [Phaeobacter gallaeciensis DSM 26640]ATE92607.1 MFS type transporter [Phaeobacter gallaeciensis]ATE97571.1 MFS type transporter [Phaeobacter gallaeciensis]ATF01272.1 MFS type transporter [Phaeobacter gallaeciensis]ATF05652.1 MFS type transporter [Phaeobacter gallaeciensis]
MWQVLSSAWALLLGMGMLMIGNGLQGTLLGVRGDIEGFSTLQMSFVMSAYFVGFLGGSRLAPEMIRRVGHVRVFAALASFISAVMILYPAITNPVAWMLGRVVIGFCFSGVYVTAESWLNNASDNANRGKALSLYMIVQMVGIVSAQALMLVGDPSGYETFVIASVVVSVSFAPILLSISPTPAFDRTKPMSLRQLMDASPLGCVGMFLLGGVFSAQFGMSAVYAASAGLSLTQISIFVATFYVGAVVMQYPLGWMSDRMDRRVLILFGAAVAGGAAIGAMLLGAQFNFLLVAAFLIGGMTNPLYSLLIAHTNDYLDYDDMPAASGGLVFINGLGAVAGPLITGWMMGDSVFGAPGFFLFMAVLLLILAVYAGYRTTQRPAIPTEETGIMSPMAPTGSPVVVEFAQEYAIETEIEEQEAAAEAG